MVKTYKFYSDSGHGWLAVKQQELVDLGIADKISHYSYVRGNTVYLEEDCDMEMFVCAKVGQDSEVIRSFCQGIVQKYTDGRSPIRSYDSYKVSRNI